MQFIKLRIAWFLNFANCPMFRNVGHSWNWICSCPGMKGRGAPTELGLTERAIFNHGVNWCNSQACRVLVTKRDENKPLG
jgi:hypothetical protein